MPPRPLLAAFLTSFVIAAPGSAQSVTSDDAAPTPLYAAQVEGEADLVGPDGVEPLETGMIVDEGWPVRTRIGRVELRSDEGRSIVLDRHSSVEVMGPALLSLQGGHVHISLQQLAPTTPAALRVDTTAGSARLRAPGSYRLTLDAGDEPALHVQTLRGASDVLGAGETLPLDPGEETWVRAGTAPELPRVFNVADASPLDRLVEQSVLARAAAGPWPSDLPQPLAQYGGLLARHGNWQQDAAYGRVWYPHVQPGWRPYYQGRWQFVGAYGSIWVGSDPWSWPTHHYGRWGVSATGRWFWIPSAGWRSAWVHWTVAPGYVGWCPTGWDGRPLVGWDGYAGGARYGSSARYDVRGRFDGRGWYDPWQAWTIVPRARLHDRRPIGRSRVGASHFSNRDLPAFVTSNIQPSTTWPGATAGTVRIASRRPPTDWGGRERDAGAGVDRAVRVPERGREAPRGFAVPRGPSTPARGPIAETGAPVTQAPRWRQPSRSPYERAVTVRPERAPQRRPDAAPGAPSDTPRGDAAPETVFRRGPAARAPHAPETGSGGARAPQAAAPQRRDARPRRAAAPPADSGRSEPAGPAAAAPRGGRGESSGRAGRRPPR